MTSSSPAYPVPPVPPKPEPMLDALFGTLWPEPSLGARPRLILAAAAVGAVAALVIPFRSLGLGTFLVLASVCGVVAVADGRIRRPYHLVSALLSLLLLTPLFLLAAEWVSVVCVLAAFAVGASALAGGRSVAGMAASWAAVPLAGLRGLPWLGRSLVAAPGSRAWAPIVRTVALSLLAVAVFGALFASADAVFARWVGALVPELTLDDVPVRAFAGLTVGGLTLAGVYVALNPPRVERLALPTGAPVTRRFEWLVPVSLVVAMFGLYVTAQLTVMFGGHAYLRRTTGLTYAEYVHQGFAQLTLASVLTLAVVAAAARKAPRATAGDRLLLRVVLGALCLLTLVVVASALSRMSVYEEAYGFTQLRLLVSFFEGWLGLVVVLVLVAGVRLSGWWVPRAALLTGAAALLAMAALNPDAYVAERNLDRYEATGKIDWYYLSGLSADATPVLADLPADLRGCLRVDATRTGDWLEWNLGRARAHEAAPRGLASGRDCEGSPPR
ncbi:DUF4153 domain-containing protein [Mumia zhuanghuii]|uniref:DUF4173 domain-containing protein n=1 Tax=Mumia zhuanghuii TaxID=2585211 RepID=A0A5C4MIU8_9ACTN|nr:DUF4173 domain-containing protein [Mumia zhuanghuii]TNC42453.1 DUF4173 domain-containing protein [Mumia zhuanghuii]TNC43700.1 DUF4173 domain-containing protein [Mumia zhuanghuii]